MPKTHFIHLRYRNFWTDSIDPRGGLTIAYREIGDNKIEFATAACSLRDNFVKNLGRNISEGRLKSGSGAQTIEMTADEFRDKAYKGELFNDRGLIDQTEAESFVL